MIEASTISKAYGEQVLFQGASFSIGSGERVGIVARNGHGKSTLFKIILGEEELDGGNIFVPKDYKFGHLSQHINFSKQTILDEASLGLPTNEDGWLELHRAEAVLSGLGFNEEQFSDSPQSLSGGYQVRLNLAKLLVSDANMLLLDEPTNYLDIVSLRWLEGFLRNWHGEILLITHDRSFMDAVTTHTMSIHRHSVKKISGGTDKLYDLISEQEEHYEKTRQNKLKKREQTEAFIERFRYKASKARQVQSRIKSLEKDGDLDELSTITDLSFKFRSIPFPGKKLLELKAGGFAYKGSEKLIDNLNFVVKKGDRIGIIGKNGKGKTTLLRILAGELELVDGQIVSSDNLKINYFGQTNVERLTPTCSIEEEIQSVDPLLPKTQVRNICGCVMFPGDLALKPVSVLSGGEKSRVLLGKMLASPCNLLLLDEPTNHLDIYSSESFMEATKEFDGTLLLVTHDEHLLREVATRLIIFDRGNVTFYNGTYDEFLERIGWQDEVGDNPGTDKGTSSKKEKRQKKAKKSKELKKFVKNEQAAVTRIEKQIQEIEEQISTQQQELLEGTKQGYSDEMAKLSRLLHRNNENRDSLYQELEIALEALETKESLFEENDT